MSELNPAEYKNGEKIALAAGETVTSDSPKVNLGPAKAIVALIGSAAVAGLGAYITAVSDNVVTSGEWAAIAVATIVGSGLVGGATYVAKTRVTGGDV